MDESNADKMSPLNPFWPPYTHHILPESFTRSGKDYGSFSISAWIIRRVTAGEQLHHFRYILLSVGIWYLLIDILKSYALVFGWNDHFLYMYTALYEYNKYKVNSNDDIYIKKKITMPTAYLRSLIYDNPGLIYILLIIVVHH